MHEPVIVVDDVHQYDVLLRGVLFETREGQRRKIDLSVGLENVVDQTKDGQQLKWLCDLFDPVSEFQHVGILFIRAQSIELTDLVQNEAGLQLTSDEPFSVLIQCEVVEIVQYSFHC